MSSGLQVFDPFGRLVFDYTDTSVKFLGMVDIRAQRMSRGVWTRSGSITDARLASGTPFCMFSGTHLHWRRCVVPEVTFSGTTMSWSYNVIQHTKTAFDIDFWFSGRTIWDVVFGPHTIIYGIH